MALMDDCIEWLAFCDALAYEMKNTKASEYMLRAYLVEYPEFVDPKLELEKYKM